jgi:hypothetical protein
MQDVAKAATPPPTNTNEVDLSEKVENGNEKAVENGKNKARQRRWQRRTRCTQFSWFCIKTVGPFTYYCDSEAMTMDDVFFSAFLP